MAAAVLPEITNYDPTVYQIQLTDPVQGYNPANPNTAANQGLSNQAALNLANRTNWLYTTINNILDGGVVPTGLAALLSPEFEGTPTAPTPPLGDLSLKLSTTAFVQGTLAGVLALSVAGGINVSLSAVQAGNGILNFTGALTANIAVILPSTSGKWIVENNTTGAFSLTVKTAAGTGVAVTQGKNVEIYGDGTNVYLATNDFANIQLTGVSTSTTPAVGDQTTKIATTAFAYQLKNGVIPVPVGGGANVTLTPAQYGNGILLLQGALTAAIEVVIPAQGGQYVVANETTGAFGLTMGCGGAGTTATIPQGQSVIVYCDGTNTVLAGAASSSSFAIHTFTATAAQTTFACSYTPGNILVIQNGSTLGSIDFTATDGANVVLATGAKVGDGVQVIAFASFTVSNAVTWTGGTMLGALQLFGGDTGVAPAPGDSSNKLVTSAWVGSNTPGRLLNTIIYTNPAGTLLVSVNGSAYTAAGSSTYNPLSALATAVEIEVLGGGGGGGGAPATGASQSSFGAGGAGGGWLRKRLNTGFSAQTVTVGQGGTAAAGVAGGTGGTSSFGVSWSATGGAGGTSFAAATPTSSPAGGSAGGTGVAADINSAGAPGGYGWSFAQPIGGVGGASFYGEPGGLVSGTNIGAAGGGYGAGGGGATNAASQAAKAGGIGIGGLVMIKEYS